MSGIDVTGVPPAVIEAVEQVVTTFRNKGADYARDGWTENFDTAGSHIGADGETVVEVLIAVKQNRLRCLLTSGREPNNEAIEDTVLDRAVYAVIALALTKEGARAGG